MMQTLPQRLGEWQVRAALAILGITKPGKVRSVHIEPGQVTVVEFQHEETDGDPASYSCMLGSMIDQNLTTVTTEISIERPR